MLAGVSVNLTRRVVQLVLSCLVLGAGVALLLDARLGSDGYSMLVSGSSIATGVSFGLVNAAIGMVLVLLAWSRGRRPGIGTVVQAVLVGYVVAWAMPLLPTPGSLPLRWVELVAGFLVVCAGVAGYLAADLGAGPAEGAALAFDPPVPFRWSYSVVQVVGALVGWALGASLGPGTVLVVVLVGPTVDLLLRALRRSSRRTTDPLRDPLPTDGAPGSAAAPPGEQPGDDGRDHDRHDRHPEALEQRRTHDRTQVELLRLGRHLRRRTRCRGLRC